jgi:hypothetical protein
MFTAATGQVGTNDHAVQHYLADANAPAGELVSAAFHWRIAPPEDGDKAAKLLTRDLIPLYLHYIDDYRARLAGVGRSELAERFVRWRSRLLA